MLGKNKHLGFGYTANKYPASHWVIIFLIALFISFQPQYPSKFYLSHVTLAMHLLLTFTTWGISMAYWGIKSRDKSCYTLHWNKRLLKYAYWYIYNIYSMYTIFIGQLEAVRE